MTATAPASPPSPAPVVPGPRWAFGPLVLLRTWLWGWLAVVQLIGDLLVAPFYLTLCAILIAGISTIPAFGSGLLLAVPVLLLGMPVAWLERVRVTAFVGVPVPAWRRPDRRGSALRKYLLDARPWRAVAQMALISLWGLLVGTVTCFLLSSSLALAAWPLYRAGLPAGHLSMPIGPDLPSTWWPWLVGVAGLVVLPLVARGLVGVDVALARSLLGPGNSEQVTRLTERVETLTQTREATVDSVELERRRIERDLHDGPQQRLVAIAMDLGMARTKLDDDPERARELLDKAHAASKEAIIEMRQVARGIHPPVLTDRGLDAALSALAARSPVHVSMDVRVPTRPSPTVEAIAYFCVSEALTNVAKHSGARSARVVVASRPGRLELQVSDDGRGGADPARGTGLAGLRQRLGAVDGSLTVHSPPGGGTTLTMVLPLNGPAPSSPAPPAPSPPTPSSPTPSPPSSPPPTHTPRSTP